jgi:hypothetical protein
MIELVEQGGDDSQPDRFVEACLDAMGSIDIGADSKAVLIDHAAKNAAGTPGGIDGADRIVEMFQLIVSTPDYQYC